MPIIMAAAVMSRAATGEPTLSPQTLDQTRELRRRDPQQRHQFALAQREVQAVDGVGAAEPANQVRDLDDGSAGSWVHHDFSARAR